ncbi:MULTISPECIES: ABC transporter ATP-binding protein [Variovorax]|jgi:peptide/nickel transport system ATP-binding protein|uniref:ABC transporter ATP-binding protein n=1 Tax=Variovorax TaxID=34072 RepID=UPI0008694DB4|nr:MULTISPECIES: ABC transporter ATP-binding protein [Variovorax]MBN8753201.1 ABC transporter ATP-binding protein [Variovorax sp.]ODU11524.1 MAG: peptide ABC transporter ATP-binding protein [Variovorax sp. SCN 67-85]ODV15111.1 MAG: peptide ABC transporter ATP-binding protein [Variovorax sp. SCN 67-20]OJZ11988.1 MAG: peptide ABC transporter ATP-binding protein [Variovorax sp. 67-131]UKI05402.1 ABC transporter ATP-binding protein [Variovorax paradoxus]
MNTPSNQSARPVLSVEHLKIELRHGARPLVHDLSFEVKPGEFLAVVGESGSGKTMAARAILQLLPPGILQTGGRIVFDGEDLAARDPKAMRPIRGPGIGMVFQEPMVSLNPVHRIGEQMAEGLRMHTQLPAAEIRARILDMLRRVQIADPERCMHAYPHEFSGGMRQRIMLASVMLLKPRLLIADEPTTALDTLSQREVLDLMVGLARDNGTAVLLITHNLGLVGRYAQRAIVLEKGQLVETGDVPGILVAPKQPYTRKLVDALPRRQAAKPQGDAPRQPLVQVRSLCVSFSGARAGLFKRHAPVHVIDSLDLDIHPGEMVALVGGSGSGKTTLGRAILRLAPSQSGQILFRGEDVRTAGRAALHRFRLACQLVFQDPFSSLDPRMRVQDIVAEPLRHLPSLDAAARVRRVKETLDEVGLDGLGARYPHELSGGQRQRVAIARALVRRPAFVVADEPVSALDMTIQAQVLSLFQSLQQHHGFACLFISHDLAAVEQIADRVIVMERGRIVEQGARDAVFDDPRHAYTQALLAATPRPLASLDIAPAAISEKAFA